MSDTLQLGQHPDAEQLSAFAEQALPAHERERMLVHLAECAHCRQVVALSLPPLEESPIMAPEPVFASRFGDWFSGWRLAWIAAPALAALVILIIHLNGAHTGPEQAAQPAQVAVLHPPMPQVPPPAKSEPPVAKSATATANASVAKRGVPVPPSAPSGAVSLPMNGRNLTPLKVPPLPAQSIGGPVAMNGVMGGMAAGTGAGLGTGASAPLPQVPSAAPSANRLFVGLPPAAPSQAAVETQGAMAAAATPNAVATEDASVATAAPARPLVPAAAYVLGKNSFVSKLAPLPSGLPILSLAANLHRRVALDTDRTLFYSEDDGQHWKPVSPPWPGRAITVAMFPAAIPHPAIISAGAPQRFAGTATASSRPSVQSFAKSSLQSSPQLDTSGSSLSGTVTDSTGAIIPGAIVVLRQSRPAMARTVKTDAAGRYLFTNLASGSYQIEAAAPGFEKLSRAEEVAASQPAVANLTLAIGQTSETVSVATSSAQIELQPQTPPVQSKAAKAVAAPAPAKQTPPVFFVITDTGDRWTSADGQTWQRESAKHE